MISDEIWKSSMNSLLMLRKLKADVSVVVVRSCNEVYLGILVRFIER